MRLPHLTPILSLLTISISSIAAADSLSPNHTLRDGEVLTSPNRIFELGFFSPGNNTARFLGIWYADTPDIVVWVANRDTPITGQNGLVTLTTNGSLILTSPQGKTEAIWMNPSSLSTSPPSLHLLDSGNLVIRGGPKPNTVLWQSFDRPCNTRLPGMKMVEDPETGGAKYLTSWKSANDPSAGEYSYRIVNRGLSQMVITRNGTKRIYRTVFWNGNFVGYPSVGAPAWKTEAESRKGRLVSMLNPVSDPGITRFTLNDGGLLERYVMKEGRDGWVSMLAWPRDPCEVYGKCGGNGICRIYKTPICECLKGFEPRIEKKWDVYEWENGCFRDVSLDCEREDGFMKVEGVKFPDSVDFELRSGVGIDECGDECLKKCNCTAYADPFADSESNCLMWFGDLIDLREEQGGGGNGTGPTIYIRVAASELEHKVNSEGKRKGEKKREMKIIAASVSVVGVLILGLAFGGFFLRMRGRREASQNVNENEELELPLFDLAAIVAATKNFSAENLIGEGGFGSVYKGNLLTGEIFAVKRMLRTSRQGQEEFKSEVFLISKLQHRNLVRILGCCSEGEEKMLIYEYMHNKSLDYFIFDESRRAVLTWPKRFAIIMGIAKGLLYLHHDSRLKIIHRDLKTSNILLDESLNAKISDFGLARMFEGDDQITGKTDRVIGTYGYMAPEYAYDGKFSIKSDVFSLGVVILEIVSGKRNRGFKHPSCFQNLLEQAWVLCKESRELEMLDPRCEVDTSSSRVESQVRRCIRVGLLCVQNAAEDRPAMPSVFLMLSSDDAVLPKAKKPGFFVRKSSSFAQSSTSMSKESSCGVVTISDIEAR